MSSLAKITLEDLHLFHAIDREIFRRLVIGIAREPAQALLIMAFWLCLEDLNFPCIVLKMRSFPDTMINSLADEAVTCLKCLESKTPPLPIDGLIPLTAVTVDILVQVFPSPALFDYPLVIPGFPHPTFGSITIIPRRLDYVFPSKGMWGWALNIEAPIDDRTVFLTFSRGYPVTEAEVRELFTSYYGDNCVEEVCMELSASSSSSSSSGDQRLYARMVLRDISTVDRILSRGPIAKYRINGKHVWARKFERRESAERT